MDLGWLEYHEPGKQLNVFGQNESALVAFLFKVITCKFGTNFAEHESDSVGETLGKPKEKKRPMDHRPMIFRNLGKLRAAAHQYSHGYSIYPKDPDMS